ncbi:hypothetical protein PAMP_000245 [Pampus punctatissimus]
MLQQLCLLRPHIPAGQAHFTLITCADLRVGDDRCKLLSGLIISAATHTGASTLLLGGERKYRATQQETDVL